MYRKVLCKNCNVRYINEKGEWFKIAMNGKFTRSKPMAINKEYWNAELIITDEGVFGLRVVNEIKL